MGVDTKGFVLTSIKDSTIILELVEGSLGELIREEARLDPACKGLRPFSPEYRARYQQPEVRLIPGSASAQVSFVFKGNARMLTVHFRCDCDQEDYGPRSVSWSLGAHGDSVLLASQVGFALSVLGKVYIHASDSHGAPKPMLDKPLTIAEAAKSGWVSLLNLPYYYEEFQRHRWTQAQIEAAMGEQLKGMSAATLDKACYDRLKEMVNEAAERIPLHLAEYHETMVQEA